jgi:O-antigen ligase
MMRQYSANIARWLEWTLLAMIAASLAAGRIGPSDLSFGGNPQKLVPYLLLCAWGGMFLSKQQIKLRGSLITAGTAFLMVGLISSAGAVFPYAAFKSWLLIAFSFGFYLYLRNKRFSAKEAHCFWALFIAGHTYLCAVSIKQYLDGMDRLVGTFDHFNILGAYMLMALPVLVYLVFKTQRAVRIAIALLALLSVFILVLTFSRGAILGLVVEVAALLILGRGKIRLAGAALTLCLVVVAISFSATLKQRFGEISTELKNPPPFSRVNIWKGSLEMISSHPEHIFFGQGWGRDNFGHSFSSTYIGFQYPILSERYSHAHCLYLQLLLAWGLGGLFAFLWMMGDWLKNIWQHRNGPALFFMVAVIAILTHQVFDVMLATNSLPLALFGILALGEKLRKSPC